MEYSIKDLSKMYDLPLSTLRYYEDMGLLEEVGRNQQKQRVYTENHVKRLGAIECFKRTGLSIAKMQEFFKYESDMEHHIDEIVDLVVEHERDIQEQIVKMQEDLKHIQRKVRFYSDIKAAMEQKQKLPAWDDYKD